MADDIFTVELGENKIKIVEAYLRNGQIEITNMGIDELDPLFYVTDSENIIEKAAKTTSNLIKQLKITKKTLRVVLSDSFSYNKFIEMPDVTEKELLSAIKYQADQFVPMPLDQVNIDIEIVFDNPQVKKLLALLCASSKKIIGKVEKFSEYMGLYPDTLETETSAIARLINTIFL